MVDSRAKGARAESDIAKILKQHTGLDFKRVPMSGALHESHQLKGDLYLVNSLNIYCIEVKHYKEDHYTSKLLTDKKPQLLAWWEQTIREAAQVSRKPLLIFKFDRSKIFVAFKEMPNTTNYRCTFNNIDGHEFYVAKLDDWLKYENPRFV
jgi:Holliday junction resolvase